MLDALGEAGPFPGFEPADFAAFERKKQGSRVYTMERRAVLQKLVTLARGFRSRRELEETLDLGVSDDAPSIANHRKVGAVWAYLTRPEPQRRALGSRVGKLDLADTSAFFDIAVEHQHASLLLSIDDAGFEVALLISGRASVDRTNASRKLAYAEDRAALVEKCRSLPEGCEVVMGDTRIASGQVDESTVEGWSTALAETSNSFSITRSWNKEDSSLRDPSFEDALTPVLDGLFDIYQAEAWSTENDFAKVSVEKAVEKAQKKLDKKVASGSPGEPVLAPGVRVTILSGLFAGRGGYVAETDAKGQVKVMVGPVSVTVAAADLRTS